MGAEFQLLGDVEARVDGQVVDIGHCRQRCVLVALLVDANRPVSVEHLVDRVWADRPPQRARNTLSGYVSRLRRALAAAGDAVITRQPGGYLLTVDPMAVDLHRFPRMLAQARRAPDDEAARVLFEEALGLWRGEALATLDTPWLNEVRAALDAQRLVASLDRNDVALRAGRHTALLDELTACATRHPLDERLAGQLMLALYRCGRQADALHRYEQVRVRLAEELGADPSPPLRRLHRQILTADVSATPVAPPAAEAPAPDRRQGSGNGRPRSVAPNNLPAPLTSFVGREKELAEIRALLRTNRLVTLTGVGGAGKSRLAVAAATAGLAEHPGGTWLVELVDIAAAGLSVSAVATALGVREHPRRPLIDVVVEHLGDTAALLVLDSCEHLLDEVAPLAQRLLTACPGVRILATSRERLGITGEVLRPVTGLAVPQPDGAATTTEVLHTDATRLFCERAAAVRPGFTVDAATTTIAQVCRRLDGLPLAIELAAATMNAWDVAHVAARLDDRFRLLIAGSRAATARHQTLRAVVDCSYDSLTDAQRRLFDRLAVFAGGFTLEAAETVCAGPDDSDDSGEPLAVLLARLVDKSLVLSESVDATVGTDTRRYRMLETLRAYGLERLDEQGVAGWLRDRHAAFFLTLVESAGELLRGAEQAACLRRLEAERGNIRAALGWSIGQGDAETAMRLAGALFPLWDRRCHYSEGRPWLTQVLAMTGPAAPATRARALLSAARLAVVQGDLAPAAMASEQAAEVFRRLGDSAGLAEALQQLGVAAVAVGALDRGERLLDESLHHARAAGDCRLEGFSLLFLTVAAQARGRYDRAATLSALCETVLRQAGDPEGLGWALVTRGGVAWRTDDHAGSAAWLREGLRTFQPLGHLWGLSVGLHYAGQLMGACGNHPPTAVLLGASEAVRQSAGAALMPFAKGWLDAAVARARAELGPDEFTRAWQAGQEMPLDAALGEAIERLAAARRCALALR